MFDLSFYKGKNVLVTGHTGFKGAWMCEVLLHAGAKVTGYALNAPTQPNLFELLSLNKQMCSIIGDIRDLDNMKSVFQKIQPEIVIHMAAQPIVRESYRNPVYTYDVNVMGTANILECIRLNECVKSFINVTTDKVYKNKEWEWGYRENEELNGYDPYSNSKSCSELVTDSYKNSFFKDRDIAVSTMRAGNVIGGGDFAADRVIPDCVRAAVKGRDIFIRNPYAVRPFQHVLEPVMAYLMVAAKQYENKEFAGSYNVGPEENDCLSVCELVDVFCKKWESVSQERIIWISQNTEKFHEASILKLDCSRIKNIFSWKPFWNIEKAVGKSTELYYVIQCNDKNDVEKCIVRQIEEYQKKNSWLT